jgi:L-malate glycosyltransferase
VSSLQKPKILLVPAWYPASFFIEQMELIKDKFDFKILMGNRIEFGKKTAMKKILTRNFIRFKWDENKSSNKEQDVITVSYSYINSLPGYCEQKQLESLNYKFETLFKALAKSGWAPDLIHIQSLSDTAVFICNWAEKHRIPVILTEHIIYIRRKFDFFQKEIEKVYSRVKKVLCVSNYVYRNLLTSGFKMKDTSIIGNLVDDRFVPSSFEKTNRSTKILFVASHLFDKDVHVLFQAIKILVDSDFTDFKIDIIGLDPDHIFQKESNNNLSLNQQIEKFGLGNFVEAKGQITKNELLQAYKNYSFLVSTSISETFGLVVAEAIVYGLPVVCTDSGGPMDFVNENNGIIVPIRDAKSISDALKKVIQNLKHYNQSEISNKIKDKYGRINFSKKLIHEYNQQLLKDGE